MKKLRYIAIFLLIVSMVLTPFTPVSAVSAEAEEEEVVRIGEVEFLRETNSETYLMSDGTYECVVYAENKYYRNANDVLLPIDNAIVAASGGANLLSTQYTNTANAFDVTFSGSGTPEISISYGDAGITFTPVDATGSGNMHMTASASAIAIGAVQNCSTLNELTATGSNTATYADAFGTADLVYVLDSDALKEYIVLEDSAAPNSFNFLFTLDGVTLQETDSGATFLNAAGGEVFNLGSLYAVDANGVPTDDLTYTFQTVKDNIIGVTVTLDPEYLAAADRAFPVVIDPTVTVVISSSSTADACVCEKYPTTNYYMAAQLRTGYDTDYQRRRSYIRFSIPDSIEVGSVISAYLDVEKISGVAPTMRAYRVTGSWSSSTITWSNKPGYTTTHQSTQSAQLSSGSSWYRMDVSSIVNGWVNGDYLNYGFALVDSIENDSNHWTTLYSSDANSPHKPELHINYSVSENPGMPSIPRPRITYNYNLYRNSAMSNSGSEILNYVNVASSAIESKYNVRFTNNINTATSELNQRTGCTAAKNTICIPECGEFNNCMTVHHKSGYYFLDCVQTSSNNKIISFVDFAICRYTLEKGHGEINGAAYRTGQRMIVSLQSPNVQRTTCHELSHLIGARDNVCTSGQTCVMRYGSNVTDVWCTQCQNDISNYLDSIS